MPAQLSTIMYISDYKEKTSGEFFVGSAIGHTRIEENSDMVQSFNITVFYPFDNEKPCYVPKLEQGQVLSVANSKFSRGSNNQIDIILTSAMSLSIKPEDLPAHQINIVGIALASESPAITEAGIKLECTISDYLTKDKPIETQITLFHPHKSRLRNQVLTVKRGSSIFFSGTLTSIDDQFYVELHNFSFVRSQATVASKYTKDKMPWLSNSSETPVSSNRSIAQAIHQKTQEQQFAHTPEKREMKRKFQPDKVTKLADIATHALEVASATQEIVDDAQEAEVLDDILSEEAQEETKATSGKRRTRTRKTK